MKIIKFNENIFSDEYLRADCRNLFGDIWGDKLKLGNILISGYEDNFDLRVIINEDLNDKTFKFFNELFVFLDKIHITFSFILEQKKLIVDINSNMNNFINEMKIKVEAKKYNL